jgi:rhodanese-related sulfurtransferase
MTPEFLQQNWMWIAAAIVSGTMLIWPMLTGTGVAGLTPALATLKMNREDAIVLDVRESGEWGNGHIPGSRHITLGQLDKRLSEIEKFKGRPIIVYCATGNRSSSACGTLKKAGFEQVFNLSGGIAAWGEANLPITKKG